MARFTQAISEGDGISVIPALAGDLGELAAAAEAAGAEAIAVDTAADAERARAAVALPVLVRERVADSEALARLRESGADAFVLSFEHVADSGEALDNLLAEALELDVACALAVRDEDELARALERIDPDIVLLSAEDGGDDEQELERALDLLPDVPAGKLVIAESRLIVREQIVALERAGIDAVLVQTDDSDFPSALARLTGRSTA